MLVYGAISQESYPETPDQLREVVTKAQTNIQSADRSSGKTSPLQGPPRFVEVAQRSQDNVLWRTSASRAPFHVPSGDVGTRRGEPGLPCR